MRIIRDLHQLPADLVQGAIAIGNFDGVHQGHARIVERLKAQAQRLSGPAVVFTFDPHPVRLLRPKEAPAPLTWTERKAELLGELGVDALIAYHTDADLLALSPQAFFQRLIVEQLQAQAMVEGPNFFFGKDRAGDIGVLADLCQAADMALEIVDPYQAGGEFISSSRVRSLIQTGDVATAAQFLTRPYRIRGLVTHGAQRGGSIGFPTANIAAIDTVLPAPGVYAGFGRSGGSVWPAAVNIGPNPTFGEDALKIEAHLLGFEGALYGEVLEVDFLQRLRDIRPFESVDALKAQLTRDVAATAECCRAAS
ncbi:bifunctional riboflavin kinase/FAD synthetase [Lignipirellula cremea]|uniref:Riboflavin biosynthesis protein n=1 Tax=Lignipirellula cremea TaxID=2528010 RepID=A0A518E0V2_9BACT|nr:bifunctional riboflavin kinase/FAD synthetase [Lignipirellula cremea]QDU97714.1 Riboflavin kinase [Lignipirellula cremea]